MQGGGGGVAMASGRRARRRATIWRIPEELWVLVKAVLPAQEFLPSGGRPWIPPRQVLDGVLYVLRTGCQWKAVPAVYGSGSTVHRRFQHWVDIGAWEAMWRFLLENFYPVPRPRWQWQVAVTSILQTPLGGG